MSDDLFPVDVVTAVLDEHGIGSGAVRHRRVGEGHSNLTYRVERDDVVVVLRRGPRPPLPRSTHDMVREARVQRVLAAQGVPVPEILAVVEDESLIGVPFYVSAWLDGVVVTDAVPPALDPPAERRRTVEAAVETLLALHAVPVDDPDVAALGRPEGYLGRQVERFAGLWSVNSRRDLPAVDAIGAWLAAHLPTTQRHAVVHGDYRLGNLMSAVDAPARVRAVLDWEMATLGDPLADVGYLLATYAQPGSTPTPLELTPVTREPGYPTRDEVAEAYAVGSGLDLDDLRWYETLALWKAAIFCEAMYTRWVDGERPGDSFAESLGEGVPLLVETARARAGH